VGALILVFSSAALFNKPVLTNFLGWSNFSTGFEVTGVAKGTSLF
jgi:hypothetical protein